MFKPLQKHQELLWWLWFYFIELQDRRDLLIQEYEEQIRELRQKKVELEQKVSVLEWQLENMKQKLELQEISHRREISSSNEKVSYLTL